MKDIYRRTVPADRERTYSRVLEILADYWLEEPEEDIVCINMYFRKGMEEQEKELNWYDNRIHEKTKDEPIEFINAAELMAMSECDFCKRQKQRMAHLISLCTEEKQHTKYDLTKHNI